MNKISVTNLVATVPSASTNYDFDAEWADVLSIQVVWGSTTASFAYILQTSNDGTNFTDLGSSQAISNNSGTTHTQIKGVKDARYFRVALTKTSGTLTTFKVLVANAIRK